MCLSYSLDADLLHSLFMLQAFARVKPLSAGKVYAVFVGLVVFIMGLALDFVAVVFGRSSLTLTLQMLSGTTPMQQEIMLNPWQILLLTCLGTLLVMVVGFFYGVILALLYNLSANVTGGVVVESVTVGGNVKAAPVVNAPVASVSTKSAAVPAKTTAKLPTKIVASKNSAKRPTAKKRKA